MLMQLAMRKAATSLSMHGSHMVGDVIAFRRGQIAWVPILVSVETV